MPHGSVSTSWPLHTSPPCSGGGSVQVLVLDLSPPSQVALQTDQDDHVVQLPLTAKNVEKMFKKLEIAKVKIKLSPQEKSKERKVPIL